MCIICRSQRNIGNSVETGVPQVLERHEMLNWWVRARSAYIDGTVRQAENYTQKL